MEKELRELKGKTIAVVYIFEGENAPGFQHYHVWKSDIISQWLLAIQSLECIPLILDVRTFVEKAISNTLPHIDFAINLNCGSSELSPMALIPSICSFLHIPCIPCDAVAILAGENKRMSNLVAQATGINVPKTLNYSSPNGIFRPLNLGSSIGVKRGPIDTNSKDGIYQEFITGYDITTPIVYNPLNRKMDFLPTVLYTGQQDSVEWFLGEENKDTRCGFKRHTLLGLSEELQKKYIGMVNNMSIKTFCRIDARIKCNSVDERESLLKEPLESDSVYFIEINPMPTVWTNNAFSHSYENITESSNFYSYLCDLRKCFKQVTLYNFLLSVSMLSYNHVKK